MFVEFFVQNRYCLVGLVVFVAMVAWAYRPAARNRYETDGKIPFDANNNSLPRHMDRR